MKINTSSGRMRSKALATIAATTASLACAVVPAGATPARHLSFQVDQTFLSPRLTSVCGFDVDASFSGQQDVTLYYDAGGSLVREIDSQPGMTLTLSGVASGKSFSFPNAQTFVTAYTEGGVVGSAAKAYALGIYRNVPGVPADAGRLSFDDAVVVLVLKNGIPIIDPGPITGTDGHFDIAAGDAALCAALAP